MGEITIDLSLEDNITFGLDVERIMIRLKFKGYKHLSEEQVRRLIEIVTPAVRPKAVYKISQITGRQGNLVEIDGVQFRSWLLSVNLENTDRVFPFAVTCGEELDSMGASSFDEADKYCLMIIKEMVLVSLLDKLKIYVTRTQTLDYLWTFIPGQWEAWPVENIQPLLSLLGDAAKAAGVELKMDYSLKPSCSHCGILYYTKVEFESCQICFKEPCMGRRAPYSAELATRFRQRDKEQVKGRIIGSPCQ